MDRRGHNAPGLPTLEAVARALRGPAATEATRRAALRQAAWRLVQEAEGSWLPLGGSLDLDAARSLAARLAPLAPELQDAAAHAAGRAWAAAVTGPGQPRPLQIP